MKSIKAVWNAIPHKFLLLGPQVIFWLGAALNQFVMALNGAMMPVLVPGGCPVDAERGLLDFRHVCMNAGTHLKFLADILNIGEGIASIGDMLLWTGEAVMWPAIFIAIGLILGERLNERVLSKS